MVYTLRFFSLQNAVCFIILTYLVPVLFTFYIQGVLKLKNNSGAKRLRRNPFIPTYVPSDQQGWYTLATLPRTVTQYRDSVDGTRGRATSKSWSRDNVTDLFCVLSVFGLRVKGMIRLRPEQFWKCNVTRHHLPLFSLFSLKCNLYHCTKPLLAAKTSLGLP
jgi:hypothetical protein